MKLPNHIKLGYKEYTIARASVNDILVNGSNGYFGSNDNQHSIITVADDCPDHQQINTLIHELLHGVWEFNAFRDEEEEYHVTTVSNTLTTLFKDNHELLDAIKEGLHGKGKGPIRKESK